MSNQTVIRITREIGQLQKSSDLSLAVACRDVDVRNLKALIIGPPDTPYEFGFFEFSLKFNKDYPATAPHVQALTTNGGQCRFNPNIYAQGKVCLSILGTWRGERGEEWSSAQGLESILISIQSLMSTNSYENEPGYEDAKSDHHKKNITNYIAKIRHESLRISVIQRLEDYLQIQPDGSIKESTSNSQVYDPDAFDDSEPLFEPFIDLCKRRFLWYYRPYLLAIDEAKSKVDEGQGFERMPFEGPGNTMDGRFYYEELEKRIKRIWAVLEEETATWANEGLIAKAQDTGIAANLQRQYEQILESFKNDDNIHIDLELVDKNPFVWRITYFGRPMTNLDSGLLRIRMSFSPRFPEEQPRVFCETPMFHQRISEDGVICYLPRPSRLEDVRTHVEAIIDSLEDESPPYDPRTMVNPEASKLFWGSADDKKSYNKKLRRAVQRSMDYD